MLPAALMILGLLAMFGLALTIRLGQPPLDAAGQAKQRRKRLALTGVAMAGLVGFVAVVATGGGTGVQPACVGTAITSPTCQK